MQLISFPSAKSYIPRVAQLATLTFPLKKSNPDLYDVGILCYGKCLACESSLCNDQIILNWLNVLPLRKFDDEVIAIIFELITKKHIPINIHTLKLIMNILIKIISNGSIDEISMNTKEFIRYYFTEWSTTIQDDFNTVFNSYSDEEKQILYELCGMNN